MGKVLPLIAGALVAGAAGLLKKRRQARKAPSKAPKAKRAVAAAQPRARRRSGAKRSR